MNPIYTLDDLAISSKEEVDEVLRHIDLRGTLHRQMRIDGTRRSMTYDDYLITVGNLKPHKCKVCRGSGEVTDHPRTVGSLHPSGSYKCRTRQYYDLVAEVSVTEELSPELLIIFEIGHALHAVVQKALHRALPGNFEDEVRVDLPEALVFGGHADGVVHLPGVCRYVIEIKTMGAAFDELKGPKKEHILQASIYAKALDAPFIAFLYIHKENSDMKQFIVPYDDRVYQGFLRDKVRPVERALETMTPPVSDSTKYECSTCPHKVHCPQVLGGGRDAFRRK